MNLAEATREFETRYYRRATSEFKDEINDSFPNLRLFNDGPIWQTYQFMTQIDKSEQLILAQSLLKRFHPDAVKMLGENLSDEETILRNRCDRFRSQLDVANVAKREEAVEKIKSVSKGTLRKVIGTAFTERYRGRCVKMQTEKGYDPSFEMKFAGWIVATRFTFGRHESEIHYYHSIESEAKIPNPHFPPEFWLPDLRLGHLISFASWLGLCSQTKWTSLEEGNVGQAVNDALKLCGHFFEAVPQLLNGLELENISSQ